MPGGPVGKPNSLEWSNVSQNTHLPLPQGEQINFLCYTVILTLAFIWLPVALIAYYLPCIFFGFPLHSLSETVIHIVIYIPAIII
jgi:hypothetical protein